MVRIGLILLVAALGLVPAQTDPVPTVPPNKHWDRFVMLVWQYKTDVTRDRELYESLNLRGFHVDRHNEKLQAFGKETGWPFYVDHAADKGWLHLGAQAEKISGKAEIVERPRSMADPKTLEALKKFLTQNISSSRGSTAVAYAFDDEISTGSFASPIETDGGALSVAGYRKFLEKIYGSIKALNAEHGTDYPSFDAVQPRSYEAVRQQIRPDSLGKLNLSPWCDWRTYMDTQWTDALAELTRTANALDPETPAGYVGGQTPSAYGGQDYRKITKAIQWIEAYDIGASNEILRSFWDQKRPHVQTFFSSKDARRDAWFLWYYLCHGNRGVICWPEGWFTDGKAAPYITANAATFKEIQGPVSQKIIDGSFVHDPIAIYYSQPSIQCTWAMDAVPHHSTWPHRRSSLENAVSTSSLTRIAWIKSLEDVGLQAKFIHQDHLLGGVLEKEHYKVLLLNRVLCLSDQEVAAIRTFAAAGGAVVADHLCGIYDEHGKARPHGALDDLFGISRDLSKGILGGAMTTEVDGERAHAFNEKSWAIEGADTWTGMPVFERGLAPNTRSGRHRYLNLSPAGFLLKRTKGEAADWLAFVRGLFKELGVEPQVSVDAPRMESLLWKNGDRTTLCIVRNIDRRASIDAYGDLADELGQGSIKLRFSFSQDVKGLKNERSGKLLGDGRAFLDDFVPWEANVYTFTP